MRPRFIAPGVAVSPHLDREAAVNAVLGDLDLLPDAVILRAETGELTGGGNLLRRAWDLDALAKEYEEFIGAFTGRKPASDEDRFVALMKLVDAWRRFGFWDPEIPSRMLPKPWSGARAKQLFDDLEAAWSPGATAWFDALMTGEAAEASSRRPGSIGRGAGSLSSDV